MWNSFVSIINVVVERILFRFAELFWQHPVVGALFMLGFLCLSVLLWIEVLTGDARETRHQVEEPRPIRLR